MRRCGANVVADARMALVSQSRRRISSTASAALSAVPSPLAVAGHCRGHAGCLLSPFSCGSLRLCGSSVSRGLPASATVGLLAARRMVTTSSSGGKDGNDVNAAGSEPEDDDIFVKKPKQDEDHQRFSEESGDNEEGDDFYDSHARGNGNAPASSLKTHTTPSLRTAYPPSGVELPESSFLKCIEKEIEDEKLRLDKEEGAPPVPTGWEVHHVKGSSVFYGRRLWMPPATSPVLSDSSLPTTAKAGGGSAGGSSDAGKEVSGDDTSRGSFPARHERCIEKHFVRVQLTTRDAALDPECDIRGEHFPFSFFIQRMPLGSGGPASQAAVHAPTFDEAEELSMYENSIEVRLDVVDGELVVDNVVYHGEHEVLSQANRAKLRPTLSTHAKAQGTSPPRDGEAGNGEGDDENPLCNAKTHRGYHGDRAGKTTVMYNNVFGGYAGPNLDEMEEEVLDGIQSWLAERQIDDRFGEFIGQYSVWIEQAEYEQWLQQLYNYVAA